ncbi:hypothetical protein [Paramuribaculum intestinale]|uniref:hypothetical protein n=1 Tax=Paramuribaculum intestinale TaxID=2094151 RepID=UPI0025A5B279|nr:hypothetical protein [Paramuribaculum intestinale]
MKVIISVICFLYAVCGAYSQTLTVVDSIDDSPVAGASVFGRGGVIIGTTGADGSLNGVSDADYPLTFRCLGYRSAVDTVGESIIRMIPESFELGEVVVTPLDRPVMHVLCYIREYSGTANATDTVQLYSEHMADYFIATTKIRKFKSQTKPRILNSRLYARMKTRDGSDSIFRPDYRDDMISWIDLVELPALKVEESEAIRSGAATDMEQGKYWVRARSRKTPGMFAQSTDYLADSKNHRMSPAIFKLLGFTIDFNRLDMSWAWRPNGHGVYTVQDLIYGTMSMEVRGRGKWIKKAFNSDTDVDINGLFEIYPVDIEYLTVEEAKTLMRDDMATAPMRRSPDALPLPAATQRLVDIVDGKLKIPNRSAKHRVWNNIFSSLLLEGDALAAGAA